MLNRAQGCSDRAHAVLVRAAEMPEVAAGWQPRPVVSYWCGYQKDSRHRYAPAATETEVAEKARPPQQALPQRVCG